jgi:hypothetical protein
MSDANEPEGDGLKADERELLAAFDRLRPQGSLRWGLEDAMRRIQHPDTVSAAQAVPWTGLPADLWDRGNSARVGQRFVGDVAAVLAGLLATDSRQVADAAVASANVAAWDALRYLAARIDLLEARADPIGPEVVEATLPRSFPNEWTDSIVSWLGERPDAGRVLLAEAGNGDLVSLLRRAGWDVVGIEPRVPLAWEAMAALPQDESSAIVVDEVLGQVAAIDERTVGGVVLSSCVDRLDVGSKVALLDHALRITVHGGTIVVLAVDQSSWDHSLSAPAATWHRVARSILRPGSSCSSVVA